MRLVWWLLLSKTREIYLGSGSRLERLFGGCVSDLVLFNRRAEVVCIPPYFIRLIILKVLVQLIWRLHEELGVSCIICLLVSCILLLVSGRQDSWWPQPSGHRGWFAKLHAFPAVLVKSWPQLYSLRRWPCPLLRLGNCCHSLIRHLLKAPSVKQRVHIIVLLERLHVRRSLSGPQLRMALNWLVFRDRPTVSATFAIKNVNKAFLNVSLEDFEILMTHRVIFLSMGSWSCECAHKHLLAFLTAFQASPEVWTSKFGYSGTRLTWHGGSLRPWFLHVSRSFNHTRRISLTFTCLAGAYRCQTAWSLIFILSL